MAGNALIPHVAEASARPSIAVPMLLPQTVIHAIVHRPDHPRANFCVLGFEVWVYGWVLGIRVADRWCGGIVDLFDR